MSRDAPRRWLPHEKPLLPGSPSTPNHPAMRRLAYLLVGTLVTLTGGLGNALVTANQLNLQGTLGADSTEVAWLPAAYVMTNASMNLLLVKFRQQFGLRLYTEFFLLLYALVTFAHLFVNDLQSAIAVRAAHGMVGAALSTLGLYYTLQAFKKEWRLKGMVVSLGVSQLPLPIAYIFSTELLQFAEWRGLYLFELGLALFSLGCVLMLKLPPGDRYRAFERTDFLTFFLFAPGIALLCAALTFGRLLWWFEVEWIGVALAVSVALIAAAFFVEHNRKRPLLNTRWLSNAKIVRLGLVMMLVRVVLSEQSTGVVGFLRVVGLNNDEMQILFSFVLLGTICGIVIGAAILSPEHMATPVVIALLLMAVGASIDAQATNLTRPQEMYVSQFLLAFGGTLFLGPSVISLLGTVIANPANLISFSVLFGLTQNLGGLIGSSLVGTFQIAREKYHSSVLVEQLTLLDPQVASRVRGAAASYAPVITDPAARAAEGLAALGAAARREANVLAYNDVFMLIALIAAVTAAWIFLHALWLRFRAPLPAPAVPALPAPAADPVSD